jgi:hypothetical protein
VHDDYGYHGSYGRGYSSPWGAGGNDGSGGLDDGGGGADGARGTPQWDPNALWAFLPGQGYQARARARRARAVLAVAEGCVLVRARVWRELGGIDLAVPPGLALADLALRARRMRAEVLVQEGGWVTQHALPAGGCATRHARLGEAVGGLRLGAELEARWGAELRAALFRGADALPTTTVLWNMECGDGPTLGLTTEECIRAPPPPAR